MRSISRHRCLRFDWLCIIIKLQDKKVTFSQDGSQCDCCPTRKNGEREAQKGLFIELAGVHFPIGLFLLVPRASLLLSSLWPKLVVRNWERVKLRAVFSNQHQTAQWPRPLTLALLLWRIIEDACCIPTLTLWAMGKSVVESLQKQRVLFHKGKNKKNDEGFGYMTIGVISSAALRLDKWVG